MSQPSKKSRVLIVGGGFAGLNAAKSLARFGKEVEIVILDQRNHHLFQPLLYQVATAGLSPAEIATPIRSIFSQFPQVSVMLSRVEGVNLSAKSLSLDDGRQLSYDYLVLACGATHSYFGHDDWEPLAPGLKTLEQATDIRRRILLAFEKAEKESSEARKKTLQTFVIVGGGPTGVELAGAIGEMARYTLKRDFRSIDPSQTRIFLLEGGPRLLPSFAPRLSEKAAENLEQLGVSIWTSSFVTGVSPEGVQVGGEFIECGCVLWAAGVKPSALNSKLGVPLDKQGRVIVQGDLSLSGHPEVFVLGDQASFTDQKTQKSLPGVAPVAIQQGRHLAKILKADFRAKSRPVFRYIDKGQMATIGRKKAVAESGGMQFTGFTAWVMWLVVHIYYLIGFKNRFFVMLQWTWSYLTFKRGARLI